MRVYELVKDKWLQICEHPEIARHLNKIVCLEHSGFVVVGNEWVLGTRFIEDVLARPITSWLPLPLIVNEDLSQEFVDFFARDEATILTRALIDGLHVVSGESLTLEGGIQLLPEPYPSYRSEFLARHHAGDSSIGSFTIFEHKWTERKTITDQREGRSPNKSLEGDATFRVLVLVLRLLGIFNFSAPFLECGLLAPGLMFGYKQTLVTPPLSSQHEMRFAELGPLEVHGLLKAWNVLRPLIPNQQNDKTRWLSIALDRLNVACERADPVDALLDLCIALEALVKKDDRNVTHQFREKGSLLLVLASKSIGEREREKAQVILGNAYRVRGDIVHGRPFRTGDVDHIRRRLIEIVRICSLKQVVLSSIFDRMDIMRNLELAMKSKIEWNRLENALDTSPIALFWERPYDRTEHIFDSQSPGLAQSEADHPK
jgi:hypothetical protein